MKFRARVVSVEPTIEVRSFSGTSSRPVAYECTARGSEGVTLVFPCSVDQARDMLDRAVDIEITVVDPVPAQ